jgi:hypothetical protein
MARRRPDRELWRYHLGVLREVGPGFSAGRLAGALAADLVRAVRRRLPEARFIDEHHSERTSGVK